MSTSAFRIYKDDLEKLKIAAASTGKTEKEVLREILAKAVPEEAKDDLVEMARKRVGTRGMSTTRVGTGRDAFHMGDRLKSIISDAIETKLYLKTLGINLSDDQAPPWLVQYLPQIRAAAQQQTPVQLQTPSQDFSTKDMMDRLTIFKMLESMEKKETDPTIKDILRELKEQQKQDVKPPSAREELRRRLDELKEYAMTMRIFGTPEEAKKAESLFQRELTDLRKELHNAQLGAIKEQMKSQADDFQRQIKEIKGAPTELDQLKNLSELANKDSAIRAYMNTKLGIKGGESMTPEKFASYIKELKVPVGEIADKVIGFIQRRQATTTAPPPPPPDIVEVETTPIGEASLPPEIPSATAPPPSPPPEPPSTTQVETTKTPRKRGASPKKPSPTVRREVEE